MPYIVPQEQNVKTDLAPVQVEVLRDTEKTLSYPEPQTNIYAGWRGIPRKLYTEGALYDYRESRELSLTPTPRLCIQRLKLDVMNTNWEIVPLIEPGKDKPTDKAVEHAKKLFEWLYYRPNFNNEPFSQILCKTVDDVLTHDAGVFLKLYGRNGNRRLLELQSRNAALFTKDIDEYNRLGVKYPTVNVAGQTRKNMNVGYWYNWNSEPKIALEPHEVVYMMHDPRSDIPYGTSKMQVLKHIIYSCMYSEEYYEEFWREGANNPAIISPDISSGSGQSNILSEPEYQRFKETFKNKLSSYMKMLASPSKTQVTLLSDLKIINWLEQEKIYREFVVALFNETKAILGWTEDIHKATDESQQAIYIQKGLFPLLNTIQWYMNSQVIADWFWDEQKERNVFAHGHTAPFAGEKMDVMFRFKLYDPVGEKMQLDINKQQLELGLTTINDVLRKQNKPTVDWGDVNPMFLTAIQPWGQSYSGGSMDAEVYRKLTGGVEPGIKKVQQAIQPLFNGESSGEEDVSVDTEKEVVKAYQKSRRQTIFGTEAYL